MTESHEKRVKVSNTHKRKLFFEKFLVDWKSDVADRNFGTVLWKAYTCMKRYPLELNSGEEAKLLKGVGPLIADRLDLAWTKFVDDLGHEPSIVEVKNLKRGDTARFNTTTKKGGKQPSAAVVSPKAKKTAQLGKQQKPSVPSTDTEGASTSEALPSASSSLSRVDSSNLLTSVRSNSTVSTSSESVFASTYTPFEVVDFDVVFLVDNQERGGGKSHKSITYWLTKIKCVYETRQLVVGDYAWVARCRTSGRELLLDCIVERKRWDDLAHSIKENRYHEQKARLNDCGVERRILLVERSTRQLQGRINDETLYQAMANTQVQDGFELHVTKGVEESARYLAKLTERLGRSLEGKRLLSSTRSQWNEHRQTVASGVPLLTFAEFRLASKKTKPLTVQDLLVRQLTVCPGVTTDRAHGIALRFPSFSLLTMAFAQCETQEKRDTLLSDLQCQPQVERTQSRDLSRFFSAAC